MTVTNLIIQQGTTWAISWPITDTTGHALTVTGWVVRSQVRAAKDSGEVLWSWTTALGNANAAGTSVTLSVAPADSTPWAWRHGVYDVELVDPTGRVARIVEGTVTVSAEVTR